MKSIPNATITGGPFSTNYAGKRFTVDLGSDVTSIAFATKSAEHGSGMYSISIDGQMLIDGGGGTFSTLYEGTGEGEATTTVTGTVASVDIPNLTMSVTATDDWSNTVGKTVEGEPGTGLKGDTRYRARAQWRSATDVDSPFSNTNTFKTAGSTPDPTPVGPGPGGLRFDVDRGTLMSKDGPANTKSTYSLWFKITDLTSITAPLLFGADGADRLSVKSAKLAVDGVPFSNSPTLVENVW